MCDVSYRVDHPCDEPYVKDEDGACTLLAERFIARNGPSRTVMTAYTALFAFAFIATVTTRLGLAWVGGGYEQGIVKFICQPEVQMHVGILYSSLFVAILAVDIRGYGGRYPYLAKNQLLEEITFGIIWFYVFGLVRWDMALKGKKHMSGHHRVLGLRILGVARANTSATMYLEEYLKPSDGTVGVFNGKVSACKLAVNVTIAVGGIILFTKEYIAVRRRLAHARSAGFSSMSVTRGASLSASHSDSDSVSRTNLATEEGIEIQAGLERRSIERRQALRELQARRNKEILTKRHAVAVMQMSRYLVACWVGVAAAVAYSAPTAVSRWRACNAWKTVPKEQWHENIMVAQLVMLVAATCAMCKAKSYRTVVPGLLLRASSAFRTMAGLRPVRITVQRRNRPRDGNATGDRSRTRNRSQSQTEVDSWMEALDGAVKVQESNSEENSALAVSSVGDALHIP